MIYSGFIGQYSLDMPNLFFYSSDMNKRCLIELTFTHLVKSAVIITKDHMKFHGRTDP